MTCYVKQRVASAIRKEALRRTVRSAITRRLRLWWTEVDSSLFFQQQPGNMNVPEVHPSVFQHVC